ncbi:uncharacterized protein LOC113382457 [Ctenocephalides felis]|uniref:uncharacterized protein LOC113382457 n=1 Tax=Ctenocephalides felis TaxID=7515 RepID=UPI000E6E2B31|nr:uncharacterized protein LOC113382457 [Ctenocephalides felis]
MSSEKTEKILSSVFWGFFIVVNLLTQATSSSSVCTGAFDVHTDKIIRTEESTAMGAQFVDETELSTREQCLELCCETTRCDVFVYEEKNPGSCYMFHCGPPDDFRCKFSRHANYSSAVLTTPRQQLKQEVQRQLMAEAAQQASQRHMSQHEQELANLRSRIASVSENRHVTSKAPIEEKINISTTAPSKPIPAAKNAAQHCSEYQFSCHSGECIAVYNACDGIPQCIDGSDEAAELRCPPLPTPIPQNSAPVQSQPTLPKPILPIVPYDKPLSNVYNQGESNIAVVSDLQEGHVAHSNWIPHSSNDHPYDIDGRAFNHQNSFQSIASQYVDPQTDKVRQNLAYREPSEVYRNHPGGGGVDVWQLEHLQQKQVGQQNPWLANRQQSILIPTLNDLPKQNQPPQWHQEWIQQNGQVPIPLDVTAHITGKKEPHLIASPDRSEAKTTESKHMPHKHEENKEEYVDIEEQQKQPKKVESIHKITPASHDHEDSDKKGSNPEQSPWADELGGEAERPGGAVLSLTLGVCITAALAVLIGCRLRLVKRRVRRHGKSAHAHDPDYLVNGMYL